MEELVIKRKKVEFREVDIEKIEDFHRHCLKHALAGQLWRYGKLWAFAHKFRKKQKKFNKKREKKNVKK